MKDCREKKPHKNLERKEQELEQLRMDCEPFKARLESVQEDSVREKDKPALRQQWNEAKQQLLQQAEYCTEMGAAACTILWGVSSSEEVVKAILGGVSTSRGIWVLCDQDGVPTEAPADQTHFFCPPQGFGTQPCRAHCHLPPQGTRSMNEIPPLPGSVWCCGGGPVSLLTPGIYVPNEVESACTYVTPWVTGRMTHVR